MTRYIALLRAVNVGGTGKLPMADLRAMCVSAGYSRVETYIASGNVVFTARGKASSVKETLEARLMDYAGKPVGVVVRTAEELADILAANPFPMVDPARATVVFLDAPPPRDALHHATGRIDEEVRLAKREIYIAYPSGIGSSKLKLPAAKTGTARNMNTIAQLVEIASQA